MSLEPIKFENNKLILIDQRKLPTEETYCSYDTLIECHDGIRDMVVRGAPAIGFTAIYGMALWLKNHKSFTESELMDAGKILISARPTAVNLEFEVNRIIKLINSEKKTGNKNLYEFVKQYGDNEIVESEKKHRKIAELAMQDLDTIYGPRQLNLLTHCNTGYLACGSLGTALGIINHLHDNNRVKHVYADETRPYLQGSRLTAFELVKANIPHHIVVEGAASFLMSNHKVDAIFVGADRIVANGDTANKVGTSNLAIIAKNYGIPFYVAAPVSSFDTETISGKDIHIEMRPEAEITNYKNHRIAPYESSALNPSFDVTESKFITGIICEKGIIKAPYEVNLKQVINS